MIGTAGEAGLLEAAAGVSLRERGRLSLSNSSLSVAQNIW